MVIRHNWLPPWVWCAQGDQFAESVESAFDCVARGGVWPPGI